MTISRRSVLTGIGAAAIAPALPSVAQPTIMAGPWPRCVNYVEPLVIYGRSPAMDCLPAMRELAAFGNAVFVVDEYGNHTHKPLSEITSGDMVQGT